jgi:lambda family phage portal protein
MTATARIKKAWAALRGRDVRNYAAGDVNRLTADWPTAIMSPTTVLRSSLTNMRARSRNLVMNNDYARRFISMVGVNVAGPTGIGMQSKAKFPDGTLDKYGNDQVEAKWEAFNKKGNFEMTGQLSGADADRLSVQTIARDGEHLIRWIEGIDNDFNCAVQFLEADHLDETLNVPRLPNGNNIRMGKEFDPWFRPVAYYVLADHPGDSVWSWNSRHYTRIPAEEIIHPFIIDRFNQPRGVPWMHSAMTRLNNIGAYEEAAIMKSRLGASTMGIWERDEDADPAVNPGEDAKDTDGTPIMDMEAGIFVKGPKGYTFKPFDPGYPTEQFGPFMKSSLRGIASGLLVSYNSLASDLEGVNYSSIRAGVLEERDCWKVIQGWMIQNYKQEIFKRWLRMQLLVGNIPGIPVSKLEKFGSPKWQPRVWAWVDPEKDVNARITAIEKKLTSRSKVAAEDGEDYEELLIQIAADEALAKKYGIDLTIKPAEKPAPQPEGDDPKKKQDPEKKIQELAGDFIKLQNAFLDTMKAFAPKEQKIDIHNNMPEGNVTVNSPVTVNPSSVTVNTPETKVENTIQPAAVTVHTPAMKVENYTTVEPSAPAAVTVAPAVINVTTPEVKIDNKMDVHVPEQPVTVNAPVTVNTPPAQIENKVDIAPASVTVNQPDIHLHATKNKNKKTFEIKDKDGKVIRTAEMKD